MRQTWTRLSREESIDVLNKLGSQRDSVVFSKETTEVSWRSLPFYTRYKLYKITNYATLPIFTMHYLCYINDFIALDGTANPIYTVNEKDRIRINEMNVIPYLEFFFGQVQGSEGEIFLIKDPKKLTFLQYMHDQQRDAVYSSFKALKVTKDPVTNAIKVSGTIYYGGSLISSTIVVTNEGKLSFQEQSMLVTGIYAPQNLYGSSLWTEGR